MRIRGSLVLIGLLALASSARGGVYIETVDREAKSKQPSATHHMWVEGGLARFQDEEDFTIFKGDSMLMVNPSERSYLVIDRESVKAMAARMNAAMARMKAKMASMPPEQRAMMERMSGGQMSGAAPKAPSIEAVDAGRSETVDGRSCHWWTVKRDGVAEEQHCVVPFASLPGHEDLRKLFGRMAALVEELRASAPSYTADMRGEFKVYEMMNGFPVLTRELAQGKPTGEETRVTVWRDEAVPAEKFAVPAGYQKRDIGAELDER